MAQDAGEASLAAGARRRRRQLSGSRRGRRAGDAMVTCPTLHGPSTTVAELRTFFADERVHAALLVDADQLIGVIERADLTADINDYVQARTVARLEGRTIRTTETVPAYSRR